MEQLENIDRLEAVRAVADPHRMAVLRRLMARPETISSLGRALGKHPAWVRHHVLALEAVGLVHLTEERTTRNYTERFYGASAAALTISMLIRPEITEGSSIVALVSHDLAVELLASAEDERTRFAAAVTGSLDGLIGVRQGLADIAGCHLLDFETGQYNLPYARHLFPDRTVMVVTLAHREQGLIVPAGNPLGLRSLEDVVSKGARMVNRNRGSGTRLWIDHAFAERGIDPASVVGHEDVVDTHTAAAERVAAGQADVTLGIAAAGARLALDFVPLFRERYDLVMPEDVYGTEQAARIVDRLHAREFRRSVSRMDGYEIASMGDEYRLAL